MKTIRIQGKQYQYDIFTGTIAMGEKFINSNILPPRGQRELKSQLKYVKLNQLFSFN